MTDEIEDSLKEEMLKENDKIVENDPTEEDEVPETLDFDKNEEEIDPYIKDQMERESLRSEEDLMTDKEDIQDKEI